MSLSRRSLLASAILLGLGTSAFAADKVSEIRIDWATYNPVSMVLKDKGLLEKEFEKDGIKIHTGARAREILSVEGGREVVCDTDKGEVRVKAEKLLLATGRWPATKNQGLEDLGLEMDRGFIKANERMETNLPGVYAVGDVVGGMMLAHKASHEGTVAAENCMGGDKKMSYKAIPGIIFTSPEVASVGLTEKRAKAEGYEIRVGRFPFAGNGKAIALGEDQGLVKTIFDKKTGKLLGAHLIGAEVTELIQGFVIAMNCETTEEELINAVFPHPTLSEMMHESVLDAYGRVLNM